MRTLNTRAALYATFGATIECPNCWKEIYGELTPGLNVLTHDENQEGACTLPLVVHFKPMAFVYPTMGGTAHILE